MVLVCVPDDKVRYPVASRKRGEIGVVMGMRSWETHNREIHAALVGFRDGTNSWIELTHLVLDPSSLEVTG